MGKSRGGWGWRAAMPKMDCSQWENDRKKRQKKRERGNQLERKVGLVMVSHSRTADKGKGGEAV